MDTLTEEKRSWNMSRIKNRDTKPELIVRSMLHRLGLRFRLHRKDLPGKPDIVLAKFKKVIFVNGCFWHRHAGCKFAYKPKSRVKFWNNKFKKNIQNDIKVKKKYSQSAWNQIIIWECETKDLKKLENKIRKKFSKIGLCNFIILIYL